MRYRDVLICVLIMIIGGNDYTMQKLILNHVPPISSMLFQQVIFVLCAFAFRGPKPLPIKKLFWRCALLGSIITPLMMLYSFYLGLSTSTFAVLLKLNVVFGMLMGVFFLKERINWWSMIGVGVAIGGITLMVLHEHHTTNPIALMCGFACPVFASIGLILIRQCVQETHCSPISFAWWTAFVSIPVLVIASLVFESDHIGIIQHIQIQDVGWMLLSGLLGIAADTMFFYIMKNNPVSQFMPFVILEPIFGSLESTIVLGETISLFKIWSIGIALCGVLITVYLNSGRFLRKK